MDDQENTLPGSKTEPPTHGLERLATLAQEFQALAQSLSVEWTRSDEARAALAQVLVERQGQHEQDQQRLTGLEGRLAALGEAQAERDRLREELERNAVKLAEQAQALDAERARAQEERAALEAESAHERTRFEELQGRLAQVETQAAAQATEQVKALEARLAEQEQAAVSEREGRAEEQKASAAEKEARAQEQKTAEAERAARAEEQKAAEAERAARAEEQKTAEAERAARIEEQKAAETERQRVQELRATLEAREQETRSAEQKVAALSSAQAEERAALEAARDQARREVDELKMQVEGLMRQADGERARWQEERGGIAAERYKALSESAQLRARVEELERAPAAPAEAPAAAAPAPDNAHEELRAQIAELGTRLRAAETQAAEQARALEAERQAGQGSLERVTEEVATLKAERSVLQEKLDGVERARVAAEHGRTLAESERDRARSESSPLWGTIESLQRQIHQERERAEALASKLPVGSPDELRTLEERLATETRLAQEAAASADQAQADLKALRERLGAQQPALKGALAALRRTPFVSPTLRVAIDALDVEAEPSPSRSPHTQRLLFLDRDPLSVEAMAQDLEQHGTEVLVAHYAEEVSFFLKTSEARNVNALIADVMAFKSDQDMVEHCRAWRQELPGAALVVSYRADNHVEAERARHVPANLGAINVARTVAREALLETLAKRAGKPEPPPSGVFRLFGKR